MSKLITTLTILLIVQSVAIAKYPIVDTGQDRCYNTDSEIAFPKVGEQFFGQDGQYEGNRASYRDNGDGTVTDLVTGLMWQKSPNLRSKVTFRQAVSNAKRLKLAGYSDWRLPSIKELYSLIDFRGYSNRTVASSKPYLNTKYFDFSFGQQNRGERLIDAQYWSATEYVGATMGGNPTVFGVNFADGRIKGYPKSVPRRGEHRMYVRYVRANSSYGQNDFQDNGDGTITDKATGLTWMKGDSQRPMSWMDALAYAEKLKFAGHDDWRLPNAKELQSIVNYSKAPDAKNEEDRGPAINSVFDVTNPESYFWTSTTHLEHRTSRQAVYICFGQGMGYMFGQRMNVHGAGAQRSDPKTGNPRDYPYGRGPQGDDIRIYNYVRCVRAGKAKLKLTGPPVVKRGSGSHFVQRLDRNGDGKVSRREFDGPPFHFDVLDKNKDGYLQANEAPPPPRRWFR